MSNFTASVGRRVAVAVAAALAALAAAPAASAAGAHPVAGVRVVVRLSPLAASHAAAVLGALPGSRPVAAVADRWSWVVPSGEVDPTIRLLRRTRGVEYAEAAHTVRTTAMPSSPNDPCYAAACGSTASPLGPSVVDGNGDGAGGFTPVASAGQPDLAQVGAPAAWAVTHGSPRVLVAVLDTGVQADHEDLAGDVVAGPNICAGDDPLCTNVNGGNARDTDDNGHGTHVTGTVAAQSDDGKGVASLGWATRAETFKVLDKNGGGTTTDLATGIYDAVAAGASVINMSLGNDSCGVNPDNCGPDADTQSAVEYAQAHDVVVVAAAGNEGRNAPTFPAAYPGVLSVGAVDRSGKVTPYSQWGVGTTIAAPGDAILSTWNASPAGTASTTTYAVLTGTSMATPHVAAAAALVRAVAPQLPAAAVVSLLRSTSRPVGGHPIDGGLLDAGAAVRAATAPPPYAGYRVAGTDGSVFDFGASPAFGDLSGTPLNRPVVAFASRADQTGYWEAATDGGVFTFGRSGFFGSAGAIRLNRPIVGMAATPDGGGYWLVASDGGIFSYGDAAFHGSTGAIRLNQPIVGMAVTPDGGGYWLVASDGGIFAFGDAAFLGSTGALHLNKPIVGMAAVPDGGGYWLVASDGGIFSFGGAGYHGSTGAIRLDRPITSMLSTSDGGGYWLAASDGGIFSFGDATFDGSAGGVPVPAPITAIG